MELGFARSGNMQIELLQPVRGEGLHVEFLASNGPGAHHLGFLVDDLDAVVAVGEANGFPKLMGSQFGSLRFCYLDTWDALGLYVELVAGSRRHDDGAHALALNFGASTVADGQPATEKPPSTASVWPVM